MDFFYFIQPFFGFEFEDPSRGSQYMSLPVDSKEKYFEVRVGPLITSFKIW